MSKDSNSWDILMSHEEHVVTFGDVEINVHDGVFTPNPTVSQTASMIIEHLPDVNGKRIADVGTGTGVIGVISALKGAAEVVATDIDDRAITNALENVASNQVDSLVSVVKTNVLDGVQGKFDFIFANIPILEEVWDERNIDVTSVSEQLMKAAQEKLKNEGQLFVPWGSFAEDKREELEELFLESGFSFTLETKKALGYTWYLYKIKIK